MSASWRPTIELARLTWPAGWPIYLSWLQPEMVIEMFIVFTWNAQRDRALNKRRESKTKNKKDKNDQKMIVPVI